MSLIEPVEESQNALTAISEITAQDRAWLTELEEASNQQRTVGTDVLGSFGAKAGLFVLRDGGAQVFSQTVQLHLRPDGFLVDEDNRQVVGFAPHQKQAAPLRIPALATKFVSYGLDDHGVLYGVRSQADLSSKVERVELGRLCLAFLPAPQELAVHGPGTLTFTAAAGTPRLVPSDAPNVPNLEQQPSAARLAAIRESAKQMWLASAHAEIDVAIANSKDELVRIALDAVK